jgi:hypothetical protein
MALFALVVSSNLMPDGVSTSLTIPLQGFLPFMALDGYA